MGGRASEWVRKLGRGFGLIEGRERDGRGGSERKEGWSERERKGRKGNEATEAG